MSFGLSGAASIFRGETTDTDVHVVFDRPGRSGIGHREQIFTAEHPTGIAAESQKQIEFRGGHRNPGVVRGMDLPAHRIATPAVEPKRSFGASRWGGRTDAAGC